MENILELLYDQPARVHEKDSPFVNTAQIRNKHMELLTDSMTDEQHPAADSRALIRTPAAGHESISLHRSLLLTFPDRKIS